MIRLFIYTLILVSSLKVHSQINIGVGEAVNLNNGVLQQDHKTIFWPLSNQVTARYNGALTEKLGFNTGLSFIKFKSISERIIPEEPGDPNSYEGPRVHVGTTITPTVYANFLMEYSTSQKFSFKAGPLISFSFNEYRWSAYKMRMGYRDYYAFKDHLSLGFELAVGIRLVETEVRTMDIEAAYTNITYSPYDDMKETIGLKFLYGLKL